MPSLVEKRQLSYPVTLLCALLVERLYEFDAQSGDRELITAEMKSKKW